MKDLELGHGNSGFMTCILKQAIFANNVLVAFNKYLPLSNACNSSRSPFHSFPTLMHVYIYIYLYARVAGAAAVGAFPGFRSYRDLSSLPGMKVVIYVLLSFVKNKTALQGS